jgi:PKD repeat protein
MKNIFYALTILTFITSLTTSCSKPTEACFTYSPTTITTNTTVTFNASCSDNASYFYWNFGDNTADTTTTSLTITHKFNATGQYTVKLNAKRKDGMTLGKDKPKTIQIITVQ